MKNRTRLIVFAVMAGMSSSAFAQAPAAPPEAPAKASWTLTADHGDAIYDVGQTVTYTVKLSPDAKLAPDAELFWRTDKDGVAPFGKGSVKLKDGSGTFTAKLDEPGFLQCKVSNEPDGKTLASWGVAYAPTELKRSLPIPADFDEFWSKQLAELAKIPINPKLTPVANDKGKGLECYDTKLDSTGVNVSGYFAKPAAAKPKSLPAILMLHGAGVRSSSLGGAMTWASQGMLAMDINAHGIENGKDEAFYKGLLTGALDGYRFRNRESKENGYFVGMFLRARRALDFLCSQPEWDGKTLIVSGGSQGGFQALACAALDDRVTMMVANIPAGCDHSGMLAKRIAGWPKIVPVVDGVPDPVVLEASRYIDCVNFAARCKAKVAVVSTGFIDPTCPPTSVYTAYNELPQKDKQIFNQLGAVHTVTDKVNSKERELILQHAKR